MCYTIKVKQKAQRLFDEFSYSFNTQSCISVIYIIYIYYIDNRNKTIEVLTTNHIKITTELSTKMYKT